MQSLLVADAHGNQLVQSGSELGMIAWTFKKSTPEVGNRAASSSSHSSAAL
jgi:hypothetical protein